MGGKGGSGDDNSAMMQQIMDSMSGGEAPHTPSAPHIPQAPPPMQMPDIIKPLGIDWTDQNAQLAAKTKADYRNQQADRKGRLDTVLSSPLADDDKVDVTQSLLKGS
jgi:hypothetical protein